ARMTRRELLGTAARVAGAWAFAPMINIGRYRLFPGGQEYSARAVRLVRESLVIAMLSPLPLTFAQMRRSSDNPASFADADFRRYQESGIDVFHVAVGIGGPDAHQATLRFIASWNAFLAGQHGRFARVDSAADLDALKGSGKVGILLGVQNSQHFRTVDDVDMFHGMGQRVSQLTYNSRNLIGDGSTERTNAGISDFGVAIIQRMNEVGMAVDV